MKSLKHALVGLAVATAVAAPAAVNRAAPPDTATVVRAVDGDTLKLSDGRTVRLIGVDTPETHHPRKPVQCYGPEAAAFTAATATGRTVTLQVDRETRDRYGRTLAYVYLPDGQMLNEVLVREGYARTLPIRPNTAYAARFKADADAAKAEGKGLWRACA